RRLSTPSAWAIFVMRRLSFHDLKILRSLDPKNSIAETTHRVLVPRAFSTTIRTILACRSRPAHNPRFFYIRRRGVRREYHIAKTTCPLPRFLHPLSPAWADPLRVPLYTRHFAPVRQIP